MEKKALFDSVSNMEEQIGELYQQLGELKTSLGLMIEENNRLELENDHLRRQQGESNEKLKDLHEKGVMADERKEAMQHMIEQSAGHENLVKLYKEGFHICNVHFGSPRGNDEDCLFCLSLLNKK
ncbi:DNA replication initiation control protein YabA [Listeria fleischmannii 1991]|uniref:Replication initiation control protein YabA n=2 Tax=Listeria fleischmannii TaxID=1069827 RepID=A0A2X3GN16_9LIST|nr:initiation control protein YabA [Listeria fleischmannii]EMG26925.1 DNA replication initiation control protein YabA [Listeria fleischmannii subsp. fleischmannii LU2006-1]KMT57739.1 DNA replication initiation control protein YabA [Listeria fleischmannii 1991]SQC69622.1 Initiation-control protein yabA [Listeria fleischmannii subsp. fleischmannii]